MSVNSHSSLFTPHKSSTIKSSAHTHIPHSRSMQTGAGPVCSGLLDETDCSWSRLRILWNSPPKKLSFHHNFLFSNIKASSLCKASFYLSACASILEVMKQYSFFYIFFQKPLFCIMQLNNNVFSEWHPGALLGICIPEWLQLTYLMIAFG